MQLRDFCQNPGIYKTIFHQKRLLSKATEVNVYFTRKYSVILSKATSVNVYKPHVKVFVRIEAIYTTLYVKLSLGAILDTKKTAIY